MDSQAVPAELKKPRRYLLRAGGALCLICYVLVAWQMWVLAGGFLLFPFAYFFGLAAVCWLPVMAMLPLFGLAAVWVEYTAFDALDALLSLLMLYGVKWCMRRDPAEGMRQSIQNGLIVSLGMVLWIFYVGYPLLQTVGSTYIWLQDLELLQTFDVSETHVVFAAASALLLVPAYFWLRIARSKEPSESAQQVRRARAVTRALMFAVLGFVAESARAPWPITAMFVAWPVLLELRDRSTEISTTRFDLALGRIRARMSLPTLSRAASVVRTVGRALLTFPALVVLIVLSIVGIPTGVAPEEELSSPLVLPETQQAAECVAAMHSLTQAYGLDEEDAESFELEAAQLRVKGKLSEEQYEFATRLRAVVSERFSSPGSDQAEDRWAIDYVERIAGIRCNRWFPA